MEADFEVGGSGMETEDPMMVVEAVFIKEGRSQVITDTDLSNSGGSLKLTFEVPQVPPVDLQPKYAALPAELPIPGFQGATPFMDYSKDIQQIETSTWCTFKSITATLRQVSEAELSRTLGQLRAKRVPPAIRSNTRSR